MTTGSSSCTVTIGHAFTSTPICIATQQGGGASVHAANCTIAASSTTVTVYTTGTGTYGVIVVGNPN